MPVDSGGRLEMEAVKVWVEKYLLIPEGQTATAPEGKQEDLDLLDDKQRILRADREMKEAEKDDFFKSRNKRWMLRADHDASLVRFATDIQRKFVNLVEISLTGELAGMVRGGMAGELLLETFQKKCEGSVDALFRELAESGGKDEEPEKAVENAVNGEALEAMA